MLHFTEAEFARRRTALSEALSQAGLDGILLFAPESQFWLTGHDTFGYCFFQCLVFTPDHMVLLTRSADLRQAQLTSNIKDIRVWKDAADANPAEDLAQLLAELGLAPSKLGIETDTHGLTAWNGNRVAAAVPGLQDASYIVSDLRLTKSDEELAYVNSAAILCDQALEDALPLIKPGVSEAAVLAAMQGAVLGGGGD
ncbi:MAG: aminopeptidase P family N-terminal domain-containing protein, partial [Pseudomonadota bacterium]